MKKSTRIFILCLSLFSILLATIVPAKALKYKKHADKGSGFSVEYPEDWKVQTGNYTFGASRPQVTENELLENFVIGYEPVPDKTDIEKFFDSNLEDMKKNMNGFVLLETSEAVINGKQAKMAVFTIPLGETGQLGKLLQGYFVHNGKGFIICCFATEKTYNAYKPTFDRIIGSLKFFN